MDALPELTEVDRIAALPDPVLRNVQITQCYCELSAALAKRTDSYANWCTFATWASKQAGQTIRKQDLTEALDRLLATTPGAAQAGADVVAAARQMGAQLDGETMLRQVWDALDLPGAVERTSAAVARGNQKVFAEIGREFTRFAGACLHDERMAADHIESFCSALRPGDPPEGQRYLRQAFEHYYRALFESETKARAELMLLGNIEIGLHEQTRLQPEIAAALEASLAGPQQMTQRLIRSVFPYGGWVAYGLWLLRRLLGRPTQLELAVERMVSVVHHQVRGMITEHLLALTFPHGQRLRLGDDLTASFPPALQHIANPDLRALLEHIDPTPDSLSESGAVDWGDLPDRLHFIADLFRCYQATPDLLETPFLPEQVAEIKRGRLPPGPL